MTFDHDYRRVSKHHVCMHGGMITQQYERTNMSSYDVGVGEHERESMKRGKWALRAGGVVGGCGGLLSSLRMTS